MKDGLHVQLKNCDQCLFTDRKIVPDDRRDDLIKGCLEKDLYFSCHKDMVHNYSKSGRELCCRGFYDRYGTHSSSIRIAKALGIVKFVSFDGE